MTPGFVRWLASSSLAITTGQKDDCHSLLVADIWDREEAHSGSCGIRLLTQPLTLYTHQLSLWTHGWFRLWPPPTHSATDTPPMHSSQPRIISSSLVKDNGTIWLREPHLQSIGSLPTKFFLFINKWQMKMIQGRSGGSLCLRMPCHTYVAIMLDSSLQCKDWYLRLASVKLQFFYCLWQPESYFTTFSRHCKNATTILAMLQQGAFVASICGTLWQFMRHMRCLSTSSVKYQWADQLKTISIVLLAIFLTGCKF